MTKLIALAVIAAGLIAADSAEIPEGAAFEATPEAEGILVSISIRDPSRVLSQVPELLNAQVTRRTSHRLNTARRCDHQIIARYRRRRIFPAFPRITDPAQGHKVVCVLFVRMPPFLQPF